MNSRRPLTDDQRADAARLMAIFKAKKQEAGKRGEMLNQEMVALACGWSGQSAFGQYARGIIPLNIPAIIQISKALGCSPKEISPGLCGSIELAEPKVLDVLEENERLRRSLSELTRVVETLSVDLSKSYPELAAAKALLRREHQPRRSL
jgi:hypothetical protein